MTTFLDLVKAHGFENINEFLTAFPGFPALNDIPAAQLEKIRQNETMTENYLGGAAC